MTTVIASIPDVTGNLDPITIEEKIWRNQFGSGKWWQMVLPSQLIDSLGLAAGDKIRWGRHPNGLLFFAKSNP